MPLRPYQTKLLTDILNAWVESPSVVGQSPTAAGKTIVAETLIKAVLESTTSGQIYCVAHRIELIEQLSESFAEAGIPHSFISGDYNYDPNSRVFICTIQTLHRKLALITNPLLVIIDECHLAKAATYEKLINHTKRLGSRVLGITATPKGGLEHIFDKLVLGPTIKQLIEEGWLAVPKIYVPPKTAQLVAENEDQWNVKSGDYDTKQLDKFLLGNTLIYGDTIEYCKKLNPDNKPSVVFCSSIKHVYETVGMLNAAGLKAAGMDGGMTKQSRRDLLYQFRTGEFTYMVSCQLLIEGYNFPECYMGVWLRPTKSLTVWLQGNGRLMRVMPDKSECIILDQVNNTAVLGPSFIDRTWYLEGRSTATKTISGINLTLCVRCGNYNKTGLLICPYCGKVLKSKSKTFKTILEDLQCITIQSAQKLIEEKCQKILNREKNRMQKRDIAYYLERAVEWNVKENHQEFAERKVAEDVEKTRIWKNGTRDELITMYAKNKKIPNPVAKADEVLKERSAFQESRKNSNIVSVYETGSVEEIVAYLQANRTDITNPEAYAKGVIRKRLAPALESGTDEQKAEAHKLLESLGGGVVKEENLFGLFDWAFKKAKDGELTPQGESTPRVYSDDEATNFAKALVRKRGKPDLDSKDPARIRKVAEALRVVNVDAYVKTVLEASV